MVLFDLLNLKFPNIKPEDCKLHLAVWNDDDDPIDLFLSGNFEEWQYRQTKKNFGRKYIIALLQLPAVNKWLFASGFISESCEWIKEKEYYKYKTKEIDVFNELSGRLIVDFKRPGRQSYLNAEKWASTITINELKPEKMIIEEFSGYNKVLLSKKILDLIITQSIESWKSALSNVSGVYLIMDKLTGKPYIGSATGEGGIWQRWTEYSLNGHGGNTELIHLLKEKGNKYCINFQYSILEISDTHSSSSDVLIRESYWKNILCSREHGYNAN